MAIAILIILQVLDLTIAFNFPLHIVHVFFTFDGWIIEFQDHKSRDLLIWTSQRSLSRTQSSNVMSALMDITITEVITLQFVKRDGLG